MRSLKLTHYLSVFVLVAALLSACSSSPASPPAASEPSTAAAPTEAPAAAAPTKAAPEATAEPVAEEATEAPSEAAPSAQACPEGFRYFEHELLISEPTCIPNNPERIVALDMGVVEMMLLNGKTPVGSASWLLSEMPVLLPQYAETLSTIPGLGYPAELETVTSLKPDLILATDGAIDVELASKIAPVVVGSFEVNERWKTGIGFWSEVLGEQELYERMVENYDTRVAELQALIGNPQELEVSVISASTYGIWLWMPDTAPGYILQDVGLARPEAQSYLTGKSKEVYGADQYVTVTLERVDTLEGDVMFYFTYESTDSEAADKEAVFLKDLTQQPLWQSMQVVKNEKAHFVPGYWWRSQTYLLANRVLDDLYKHITNTEATTPVIGAGN
jgi:iron complex transport system substrate-binding protein